MFSEDGAVAIGEETEIVGKGIVIDRAPVSAHKRADQQKQGGLRLVEIRDELIHYMERISGFDHDLRLRMQGLLTGGIQIIQNSLQRLAYPDPP